MTGVAAAEHRPAVRRRRFAHDDLVAVDLFSGFGGLTAGIKAAGFTTIMAANHNRYKVEVHEANHPEAEHWIADLVDREAADYHSARDLPAADLLVAGVSCVNHSQANTRKAYSQGMSLFDLDDPEFEERVTRSERDRATANCFPAGTVVVARRGMVPIEQLAVGDEVLTHRNRWRRVNATVSRHAPLVTVQGRGHTALQVTADHQFLTRGASLNSHGWKFAEDEEWTAAIDLVGHAWQSPAEFPELDVPAAPAGWEYDHHFWWTVGRWLGDGWIRHCKPSGEMVGICCGHDERHELDGRWDARATEVTTTVQYELRGSGTLARWLIEHFGELAHGKTIPAWALSMDTDYRKALIEGYMSADGCSSLGGRRGSCATVSRRLAVGMKLMLQTLGYRPTLRCREPEPWRIDDRTGSTRPMWILQWMAEQRRASTIATIDGRCVGVVRSVKPARAAEVFDIEVEEDHSFVADGVIVHNCVLHYAAQHHPRLILVECTTELSSWGPAIPGRPKVGDGSTYRWWLGQFELLGYRYRQCYLNSMFFGVPQSRDRLYVAFWDRRIPAPDLDHRPPSWCPSCDRVVEAVWTWKTGIPATGSVRYGKQYQYCCPACRGAVVPPATPSLAALDLSDLGTRIGDRKKPLAAATMARAERCRQRFAEFPAVLMPAKAVHGTVKHPWQPLATQTSQQETAILSTGAIMQMANSFEHPGSECRTRDLSQPLWTQPASNTTAVFSPPVAVAVNNFQGAARGVDEPLPTQGGSETLGLVSSGVLPFRRNTVPTTHAEAMPTVTADQIPGVLTAAGTMQFREGADRRVAGVDRPLNTVVADGAAHGLLFSGWFKQNGSQPEQFPAPHPLSDSLGTITAHDTTALLIAQWRAALSELPLEDCYFRMMAAHEVGRGCGFDTDFPDHQGSFTVWGSARNQVDGFGNAVSPPVGEWLGRRMRAALHNERGCA